MFGFGEREFLYEGGFDFGVFEAGEFFGIVDGGENWRFGKHLVQGKIDAFGAALVGHPVKNEGDFGIHGISLK